MIDYRLVSARLRDPIDALPFHEWTFPDGTKWAQFYRVEQNYRVSFPDLGDFDVSADGCAVCAWPAPGISEDTMQHLYLNQVLPLALSKQGRIVFHASAVETVTPVLPRPFRVTRQRTFRPWPRPLPLSASRR